MGYANQSQESFLDGHVRAFATLGGVPLGMIRYDNLKHAVIRVTLGRERFEHPRFVAMRSHYDYDSFSASLTHGLYAVSCMQPFALVKVYRRGVAVELLSLSSRPESLSQMVYAAIREAIVHKTLPPGDVVSEVGLARSLKVSKTPVREAVLRLREHHLLEQDENRVLRVVAPSAARINNAYEIRAALEAHSAALAAHRASPEQINSLAELAQTTVDTCKDNNTFDFRRRDVELHQIIARASGNEQLAEITINAIELTDVLRTRDVPATAASIKCAYEHLALVDAIRDHAADRARDIATSHIQNVHGRLLEVYKDREIDEAVQHKNPASF